MSERWDLFWGLVIGLIGNLLVSTAFALVEHPEWSLFLNPVYICSWIAFVGFCIVLLSIKNKCKKTELAKSDIEKKENNEKPDSQSLIAEYQILNDSVNRRYSNMLRIESIMIPTSLAIVTFGIINRKDLGMGVIITSLPISFFLPLISFILIFFLYLQRLTTNKINDICFARMRKIERVLHIEGHRYIREQIKSKTWFKVRGLIWHFIFLFIMGVYVFTAYWLIRESLIL